MVIKLCSVPLVMQRAPVGLHLSQRINMGPHLVQDRRVRARKDKRRRRCTGSNNLATQEGTTYLKYR